MEKDTAGRRALNRNYIVGGYQLIVKQESKAAPSSTYFITLFAVLSYMMIATMNYALEMHISLFNYSFSSKIAYLPALCLMWSIFKNLTSHTSKVKIYFKSGVCFGMIIFTRNMLSLLSGGNVPYFISMMTETLLWLLFLLVPSYFDIKRTTTFTTLVFINVILGSVIYYLGIPQIWNAQLAPMAINSIYYILLLIPLVLLIRRTSIRLLLLAVSCMTIIYSNKATAFLALTAVLLFLFLTARREKKSRWIFLLVTALILIVLFSVFNDKLVEIGALSKFSHIGETGASGRFFIIRSTLSAYSDGNLFELFWGHGYNGVARTIGISAHNDFLEVLFDYGIIGATAYICMIVGLIRKAFTLFQQNSIFGIPMISSLIIFIIVSMSSHLIFIPRYFLFFAFFWSVVYTSSDNVHQAQIAMGGDSE